jgi:putative ABC transport system permease protein
MMQMLSELWSDLRQAFRGFRHKPGFTLVVVLSLALGIGANSAIFSVVDGVLLRPLPFKEPASLVAIEENGTRISLQEMRISPTVGFYYRRDKLHSFSDILGMQWTNPQLLGAKEPEQLEGGEITANFCGVLGVQPLLGRCFTAGEQAHHDPVAILSYSLWQRQFNGDPNILGRSITLKDDSTTKSFTVTGVLPAQFRFPYARLDEKFDLWMPFTQDTDDGGPVSTIARLRPGVTVTQARAELLAMQRRLFPSEYDGNGGGAEIVVEPLVNLVTASVKPGLVVLFAAVGLVLLITCANVASLFLSRGSVQTHEIAVRASLGAGRWRLCRQLLTESLTLSLFGGAAGLLAGSWILHGIKLLASTRLPRVEEASMNATVLAFTAAVSILSGVLSGVLPGLRLSRVDLTTAMKASGSSIIAGRSQQRTMNALVVFEIAVCVVSLIGAGLLVNTLIRLERVDPGFRSDHIVLAGLIEPPGKVAPTEFYKAVLDRVSSTPGVEAAGLTENPPPYNVMQIYDFLLPGEESRHGERANARVVNADYFQALRIPLLHGRLFRDSDNADAPHVLVISESMARHYWPGKRGVGDDAVGKFVHMGQFGKETPVEIVGVVGDVRQTGLRHAPDNQMYLHYAALGSLRAPTLVVRVKNDPAASAQTGALLQTVKTAIRSVDHDQPVSYLKTMDELMAGEVADPRFYVILLSSFAALALALTVMGIAGVVAYSASRRTREMGLRICFGATRADLLRLFARDNVKMIVAGVALGSLTALAVTRFAKSLLFEVTPTDPATFATVALILGGVSLTACGLVALRSTLIDPAAVLKNE